MRAKGMTLRAIAAALSSMLMRAVHARAKRAALCFFSVWCLMQAPQVTVKYRGYKHSIAVIAKYTDVCTYFGPPTLRSVRSR